MAKFRVEVDISFDQENDAVSFLNLLQVIKTKFFGGLGTEKIPIIAKCRYHKCFHDEIPIKQCGNYTLYDLANSEIIKIKNEAGVEIKADELLK